MPHVLNGFTQRGTLFHADTAHRAGGTISRAGGDVQGMDDQFNTLCLIQGDKVHEISVRV
jgi:hypothetical protein